MKTKRSKKSGGSSVTPLARIERAVNDLAGTMATEFAKINERLGAANGRFDSVEQHFDAVDQRLDAVDQRLDAVDQRFDAVDRRFDAVDRRFDAVDQRFDAVDQRFDAVDQRFETLRDELIARMDAGDEETRTLLGTKIDSLHDDIRIFAEAHVALEQRVTVLERRRK